MKVVRTGPAAFTAELESEQELRDEHRTNLSFSAFRLPTTESVPPDTALALTLRGPAGSEMKVKARVVAALPDGIARGGDGDPDEILAQLLKSAPVDDDKNQTVWDRIRGLSQTEKILIAVKADRSERAALLQDNDPRVLLSILRNPRLTVDEVVRLAKSSFLNFQIADVIMQTAQWMSNLDVRLALIRNPKTPQAFSLRILPSLPDAEVSAIAKGGTSMALKQAALRRIQGR